MAVAVAVVAASALLLLLLRGTARRPSGPVTLQDPLAKYPLRLLDKEVPGALGRCPGLWGHGASGLRGRRAGRCDPAAARGCSQGRAGCVKAIVPRCGLLFPDALRVGVLTVFLPRLLSRVHREMQARRPEPSARPALPGHRHGMCLGHGVP